MKHCPKCLEHFPDYLRVCPFDATPLGDRSNAEPSPTAETIQPKVDNEAHLTDHVKSAAEAVHTTPSSDPPAHDTSTDVTQPLNTSLNGVGGWLLFFVIGQLVCRPLQFVGTLSSPTNVSASQISDRFPFTATVLGIERAVMIVSIAFGVLVAIALLRTGDRTPVTLAKAYLIVNPLFALVLALLYANNDLPGTARTELVTQGISNAIVTSILCAIWFLYFTKSRRVRVTYMDEVNLRGTRTASEFINLSISSRSEGLPPPLETLALKAAPSSVINPKRRFRFKAVLLILAIVIAAAVSAILLKRTLSGDGSSITTEADTNLKARAESLSHEVGVSADQVGASLSELRNLGIASSKSEAEHGIAAIEKAQKLHADAKNRNVELVNFVVAHRSELQNQGLGQLVEMTGVYGETYQAYQNALSDFLTSYREMLVYVRDHSQAIQENEYASRKRYDSLYAKYVTTLQKQNKVWLEHLAFVKQYANEHPNVANILNEIVSKSGQ